MTTAYQKFVGKRMKEGRSMKEAAMEWKRKEHGGPKTAAEKRLEKARGAKH